jgi:6-phosphogluconolactonase (cycloisomerase 2 family)
MRKLAVPATLALVVGLAVGPPAASHESSTPTVAGPDAPVARFLYVANVGSHIITQYKVNAGGPLTPLTPASVPGGLSPLQMAASPDGRSVYVSNFIVAGTVSQYDVGAGGVLAPKSPPTVDAGIGPRHVAVHPNGRHVYVINAGSDNVSHYRVARAGRLGPRIRRLCPRETCRAGSV